MNDQGIVDLRSDTVTRPTPGMKQAIANAELGDDCIDIDPTVVKLQEKAAEMLGMESAIYMPSGTMTNQVGVRLHCQRGEEFLCEATCHIFNYEQGAFAQLSGVIGRPLIGKNGVLEADQFEGTIRPDNEHFARTKLVCLENTHNRGAGKVLPYETVKAISEWARSNGLRMHLDGARFFNAIVASGTPAPEWTKLFDTISICFSKGLGAPVGSALVGSAELIAEARRHRKAFGGGMRQAGVIAAGALYALDNNVERLAEDHANAQLLAEAIRESKSLSLYCDPVETNIVIADVAEGGSAGKVVEQLREQQVLALSTAPKQVRLVTHLDVDRAGCERAAAVLRTL